MAFDSLIIGFPGGSMVKNPPANARDAGDARDAGFDPWVRKSPWGRKWQPTPEFLLGKSHGQKSLTGYSPWDLKESDLTKATEHTLNTYYSITDILPI